MQLTCRIDVFLFVIVSHKKKQIKNYCSLIASQYFRTAVLRRPVECREKRVFAHKRGRAKVYEFDMELVIYDYILIFYVAVQDVE